MKFFDVESNNDQFATTWATMEPATTNLSAVARGDADNERVGKEYHIHAIFIKGYVQLDAAESAGSPPNDLIVRLCLVLDKFTNGTQLTATDVMDNSVTAQYLAFRKLEHSKRFTVLWDKTFRLPMISATNEGAINLFANGSVRVPFKVLHPP